MKTDIYTEICTYIVHVYVHKMVVTVLDILVTHELLQDSRCWGYGAARWRIVLRVSLV